MRGEHPSSAPTRRRLLILGGAAAIAAVTGQGRPARAAGEARLFRWRGSALGAQAEMLLDAESAAHGDRLIADCLVELRRLERIFSLFVPESAISRLNREGRLVGPPPELLELLSLCRQLWKASAGAFDPTVQPLWRALAEEAPPEGLERARAAVGFDKLRVSPQEIAFAEPGMAITLNGIAQGFITDRVAALLARHGLKRSLLQLGETQALGPQPDGSLWQIGIDDPIGQGRSFERLPLAAGALAVSSVAGPPMPGRLGNAHLLDPKSGRVRRDTRAIAVFAPRAALADGLSTALAVMGGREAGDNLLRSFPEAQARQLA